MTQTVGQMTDQINQREISTQTALPRTNLSFSLLKNGKDFREKISDTRVKSATYSHFGDFNEQLKQNEIILRSQMLALRKLDEKLKHPCDEPSKTNSRVSTPATDSRNTSDPFVQDRIDLDSEVAHDEDDFNENLSSPSYSNSLEWKRNVDGNDGGSVKLVSADFSLSF